MTEANYYKNKSSRDGFTTWCKSCSVKRSTKRIYDNYDEYKEYRREYEKQDWVREQTKKRVKRFVEKGGQLNWQRNNPDKVKGYNDKYSNKKHTITTLEWKKCKEYFSNECAYCGITNSEAKKTYKQYLHREHVDHDGEGNLSNCVPSCKECNSSKYNWKLEDWYNENNHRFTQERLDKINKWINEDWNK